MKWIILGIFILAVVLSLGMNTPVYLFLFNHIHLIKFISVPAFDYRAIFLFFLCFAAGLGADRFLVDVDNNRKKIVYICLITPIFILPAIFIIGEINKVNILDLLVKNYQWFIFIAIFLILVSIKLPKKVFLLAIVLLCILDAAYWTGINFGTIAHPAHGGHWDRIKKKETLRRQGIYNPKSFQRRKQYPARQDAVKSIFWKYFSDSGYDSTHLKHFSDIMSSSARNILTEDFRILPIYQAKIIDGEDEIMREINQGIDLRKSALINKNEIKSQDLVAKFKKLTSPEQDNFEGKVINFSPDSIKYNISLEHPAIIFFNEIYYPGWILEEEGKEIPLFRINLAFRGAYLPAGHHDLVMSFSPISFKIGLIISSLSVVFCLSVFIIPCFKRNKHQQKIKL